MMSRKGERTKSNLKCDKKESNERVWIFRLLRDIFGNYSRITYIVIGVISCVLTWLWSSIDYCDMQKLELCGDILTFCSCILGFAITGFSIVLTIDHDTIINLSDTYNAPKGWLKNLLITKSNPYDILCASFSLSCIVLLLTIITVIIYKNTPNMTSAPEWLFITLQGLTVLSSLLVFDLLMHLYAVSTYLNKNHHKVKFDCEKTK